MYLRIFPGTVAAPWFRWSVLLMVGITAANCTAFVVTTIFQCDPVPGIYKIWDGVYEAKCVNTSAHIISSAGVNILLDLIVFLLPLPELMKLQLSKKKKVGVCLTVSSATDASS